MKNKTILIISAIAISVMSILGTLLYQKTQIKQGPEAAKTAIRITAILDKQFKSLIDAKSRLNPEYVYLRMSSDEMVSMEDIDKNFKDEHEAMIKYNIEMEKLKEVFQPLIIEAKYDPVAKSVLEPYFKQWHIEMSEGIEKENKFNQLKDKMIQNYKEIQKTMKLKSTDTHYLRLQKSINTWTNYYSSD